MSKENLATLFDVIDKLNPEEVKKELKEKYLPWWEKFAKEHPIGKIKMDNK